VAVFIASFNVRIGVGEPMPYVSFGQYTRRMKDIYVAKMIGIQRALHIVK
jgi:hypothetical protein